MGTGKVHDSVLCEIEPLIPEGDLAEIGVYRGDLFRRLCGIAKARGVTAHAFDSFAGMGEPGPEDAGQYQRGALSNGGTDRFMRLLGGCDSYVLHQGYIPDCFASYSGNGFAFAYLDVDHYLPTKIALEWVWQRILPGGILGLDDVFPGRGILAGKAVDEWLPTVSYEFLRFDNNQLFIMRETR